MKDKFSELANTLTDLINILEEFEKTKDDYKKPDIRARQVKILSIAKIIGNTTLKHAQKLLDDIDVYLSNPQKEKFSSLIKDAIKLQNDLWEL
ncbi:MAG: hypothetical protein KR126chlam4_00391 [Candidatus Anoxychlamydiales bacterium]|uniref:Uncharacterized protein n=1 Tax=marine sediment metagenome TaxID=412755 RepID=A0A0F9LYT3_9ZZZZ|nr:hypothetical protein [Candidatus Anoxychlamydiales bacterium]HEU64191.1 hypothetical protein [Chlamydiota bacterium]